MGYDENNPIRQNCYTKEETLSFDDATVDAIKKYQEVHQEEIMSYSNKTIQGKKLYDNRKETDGIVRPKTRAHIEEHLFVNLYAGNVEQSKIDYIRSQHIEPELFNERFIGQYTTPGECIICNFNNAEEKQKTLTGEQIETGTINQPYKETSFGYAQCKKIISEHGGFFDEEPGHVNLLGLRGAHIEGGNIIRNGSVSQYNPDAELLKCNNNNRIDCKTNDEVEMIKEKSYKSKHTSSGVITPKYGETTSSKHGKSSDTNEINYDVYNDVILVIWKDKVDHKKYVVAYHASVDPGMIWDKGNSDNLEGTSHLRDGQFMMKLGTHTPPNPNSLHAKVVKLLKKKYKNGNEFEQEMYNILAKKLDDDGNRIELGWNTYTALVQSDQSIMEVTRDFPNNYMQDKANEEYDDCKLDDPNDGDIVNCEEVYSNAKVYTNDKHFRDYDNSIKIHIHAAPNSETSSEGCQNIPISLYIQFLNNIWNSMSEQRDEFSYMLLDASKVKATDSYDLHDELHLLQEIYGYKNCRGVKYEAN